MRRIARLTTRLQGEGDGLILGATLIGHDFFKPNTVYEIQECMGEIQIKEIGQAIPAEEGQNYQESPAEVTWAAGIEHVMAVLGKTIHLSREEYEIHCKQIWEKHERNF